MGQEINNELITMHLKASGDDLYVLRRGRGLAELSFNERGIRNSTPLITLGIIGLLPGEEAAASVS